ncbi:MAG TPA: ImmA/IrrE family metallo-endopeptidase, partial [Ignavibacteria bacterium]
MDQKPDSFCDIENIAINILKDSRSYGIFPTPVDKILNYTELKINTQNDLSSIEPSFISKAFNAFVLAKRKVLGLLDYFNKEIYIDSTQNYNKKRFIKLHETGHKVIPWQQEIMEYYVDDKRTLDPDTKELFESEANYFASSTLFQLNIFDEESKKLPLSIESPIFLAKKFGASNHASIRRYVEHSQNSCALLVFEEINLDGKNKIRVRNYFQSKSFTKQFGELIWPENMDNKYPFMYYVYLKKKKPVDGEFSFLLKSEVSTKFQFQYYNNGFNTFVFIRPIGEFNK